MKKYKIALMILIISTLIFFTFFYINRLYISGIESTFGFNTKGIFLNKTIDKQHWLPNGDGTRLMIIEYIGEFNKNNLVDFNTLPIHQKLPMNAMPRQYLDTPTGYYKFVINKDDNRDISVLIIDTSKQKLYVYYQVM